MKRLTLLIGTLLYGIYSVGLSAQITDSLAFDSLNLKNRQIKLHYKILDSKAYQMGRVGVPLIILGACTYQRDMAFRNMRNSYIPTFRFSYDDYLQYSPGVIMLGMKAFGVEGRSSWGRMITSDAFATGIMAIAVNSLKAGVGRRRPDNSSNNSFPSGHTATAFMLATMLHKEYGTTRSPLYSVLGYSLATGTAISRQLNNRHWFSDVLTGAGIGIVSTELGYFLADLIFKNKGLVRPEQHWNPAIESDRFSYFGLQMGYSVGKRTVHLPEELTIEGSGGATSSLLGGWFFSRHWGLSGKFSVSQVSPSVNTVDFFNLHPLLEPLISSFQTSSMSYANVVVGAEYKTRIFPGVYVGGNLMGGFGWADKYRVDFQREESQESLPLMRCEAKLIPNLDLTAYLMHVTERNMGIKLFFNYNAARGKADYTYYPPEPYGAATVQKTNRLTLHNLSIGAEISALFWK